MLDIYNAEDYNCFYNVKIVNVPDFNKLRALTYDYRDHETGWLITEELIISSDNKLFFHLYHAVLYEYNINLENESFEYI